MSKQLNRTRVRDIAIGVVVCLFIALFTSPTFAADGGWHSVFELTGNILIIFCVLGRVFTTAFIGGQKNISLVTYGPFSICRNPLYFFSFLGATGAGLISNHILLMVGIPLFFCWVFFAVMRREEVFLHEKFGEEYARYCASTPRFFPALMRYHAPDSITMTPRYLLNAAKDAMLWLVALPAFEVIEYLHANGTITPLF